MKNTLLILTLVAMVALMIGCSEKQKEAAKLEKEMEQMDSGMDTLAEETMAEETAESPKPDATAVPEEETPSAPTVTLSTPEGDGYTVQVASCEDPAYANYLSDLYKKRGYEVFISKFMFEGLTYYRVRLGSFATLGEAKTLQNELTDKYSLSGWVAPIS